MCKVFVKYSIISKNTSSIIMAALRSRCGHFAAGRRTEAGDATDRTIGQWRRRLKCIVQQQGGYSEHLM